MRVLVAGAGPAGAALSLLLARNGVEVVLVERERGFERVFRGEGLTPSGVDALFQMGLRETLEAIPTRVLESWDVYLEGAPVFRVREPVEETGELAFRVVPQPALLERMVAEAARHPGFAFEPGTGVIDLLRDGDRVTGARLRTREGERELRADYVVGCDGRGSTVRRRAGLELALLPEHYDVAWFKAPVPPELREHCSLLLMASGREAAAAYPSWDERLHLAWMMRKGSWGDVRDRDAEAWTEAFARVVPPWLAAHLRAVRDAMEGPVLLDVVVGRAPRWSAPGLLLLGDAAHPMSPIRAQGINVALRDAIVAANHLVPTLRRGDDPAALDAAARAAQAEREPEIVRAQTLQLRDARGMGTRFAPLLVKLAKHLGRLAGRHPCAGRLWLAAQHDLRFGATRVRLEV